METNTPQNDHDLLIAVNENVKNLSKSIEDYMKTSSETAKDHEVRIRIVEDGYSQTRGRQKAQTVMLSVLGVVVSILGLIVAVIGLSGK
jgi:hypothetical protein